MGYVLTKIEFIGRKALLTLNFVVIMLPIIGALPSQYRMYSQLGFIDSPLYILTYFGGFGSNLLIIMSFFRNLSNEYRDAARIDGAGEYRILFQIMIPLALAPLLSLYVLGAVSIWNDYQTALIFLPNMPTLATGIFLFSGEMTQKSQMEIHMAATVLSAIPPLILFIILNKMMLTSLSIGGIKE